MESRYLYRGKRLNNGEWICGDLVHSVYKKGDTCVGQYENDVVNCLAEDCCGYIGWNESEAGFYFNTLLEDGGFEEEHIYDYQDCMEVIGNTFDNPELLEV